MCVDLTTNVKSCTCGDTCGKELSKAKVAAKEQERYHEYIKRKTRETRENDANL